MVNAVDVYFVRGLMVHWRSDSAMKVPVKEPTVRDYILMRQNVAELLESFLHTMWLFNPPDRDRHFKTEFRRIWERAKRKRSPLYDKRRLKLIPPEQYREEEENKIIHDSFLNILLATARNEVPAERDLRQLTKGLNRDVERVRFFPDRHAPTGDGPYMPSELNAIRAGAELLLRYLNLTHRCGLAHGVCEVCGGLMTKGRGGKKVCSPECRDKRWSYGERKNRKTNRAKRSRRSSPLMGVRFRTVETNEAEAAPQKNKDTTAKDSGNAASPRPRSARQAKAKTKKKAEGKRRRGA